MICEQCGCLLPDGVTRCPNCGMDYDMETVRVRKEERAEEEKKAKKDDWWRFPFRYRHCVLVEMDWIDKVVWIQLVAIIAAYVVTGVRFLFWQTEIFGVNIQVETVHTFTTWNGIICLVFAAFAFIVRKWLIEMKSNASILYLILLFFMIIYELIIDFWQAYLLEISVKSVITADFWNICLCVLFLVFGIYVFVRKRSEFWC